MICVLHLVKDRQRSFEEGQRCFVITFFSIDDRDVVDRNRHLMDVLELLREYPDAAVELERANLLV